MHHHTAIAREMLSATTQQTFPSFEQVSASSCCSSSSACRPALPIPDGTGCRSRTLSAHSRLTRNQLGLMDDRNATGSTFCNDKKMHQFLPPPAPFVLFTRLFSPHFYQLLQNSTRHIGSAADAEFVQLTQSFLSDHHLTL